MAGIDAFGTKLERSDMGAPAVFTAVANVTEFGGPELARETIDMTAHDTPDAWREFKGSLRDGGELTLSLNYDPGDHDLLIADLDDEDPRNYRLVWPHGIGTWELSLILTKFNPSAPIDDKLAAEATYKVTGKPNIITGP